MNQQTKNKKTSHNNEETKQVDRITNVKSKIEKALVTQDSNSDFEDLNFGTFDYSDGKVKPAYLNIKKNQKVNYSLLKKS